MKKIIAFFLVIIMSVSAAVFAADFKDMPNDWSTSALQAAVKNGLLTGNNGYIKAQDNMTRAEMATIMVRACGVTKAADISGFSDVSAKDWFFDSMAKAVAMGAFKGSDGKLNPDSPITRQEAFLVLSRVFGLNTNRDLDMSVLDQFKDAGKIDEWAKAGVASTVASGYVAGSNGYINPLNNISRAEFAVVMDRLVKYYIDELTDDIPSDGNLMIRVPAKMLSELKTDKLIIIGDSVDDVEMNLVNNELSGKLVVRGGSKITLTGGSYNEVAVVVPNVTLNGFNSSIKKAYACKDSEFFLPAIKVEGEDVVK
jgi:hypothetical protein